MTWYRAHHTCKTSADIALGREFSSLHLWYISGWSKIRSLMYTTRRPVKIQHFYINHHIVIFTYSYQCNMSKLVFFGKYRQISMWYFTNMYIFKNAYILEICICMVFNYVHLGGIVDHDFLIFLVIIVFSACKISWWSYGRKLYISWNYNSSRHCTS